MPGATVPAVLLLEPNRLKATLRPGRAGGNLWMLPPPTARLFCPPPLSQDKLTGNSTTCSRCGPHALATPWPLLQLLARYHPMPTAHTTSPSAKAEWRFHRGTWDTQHPDITFLVLANNRSATPEAPAYPVKHRCSQVQDWQTVEWTTFHPQTAYLLQYVYAYRTNGQGRNENYVRMNPVAT